MKTQTVYLSSDSPISLVLWQRNTTTGELQRADLATVLRTTLTLGETTIDSDVATTAFDWSAGNGLLILDLGSQTIAAGQYMPVLKIYDSANLNGIPWGVGDLVIDVRE